MKKRVNYLKIIILLIISFLYSCFPTYQVNNQRIDSLSQGNYLEIQAKLFTNSNNVVLFPNGFEVKSREIIGRGLLVKFGESTYKSEKMSVSFDSILAIITYQETTTGARNFGNFLLGLTGPPLSFLGAYCLACPKCCFGSCPTIYSISEEEDYLEAELFSESISKQLQANDLDVFMKEITSDEISLKITNEALETHYIDKFELLLVEHSPEASLYLTNTEEITTIMNPTKIRLAKCRGGNDITKLLLLDDDKGYRSGVEKTADLKNGPVFDYIDLKPKTIASDSLKMIVKFRNTLLSTTLLYDIVIGSQGIEGLAWTEKMNSDSAYASQFKAVYEVFSGIAIKVFEDGRWRSIGRIKDAGPLSWKEVVVKMPSLNKDSKVRLEFIPDNFIIDYIGFDAYQSEASLTSSKLIPYEIKNAAGEHCGDIQNRLSAEDESYLMTEPGDSYTFSYKLNPKKELSYSTIIKSNGYYNEWIRGSWITSHKDGYTFDLYNIKETLSKLADSWQQNYHVLEKEFNSSRVLLKETK